MLFKINQKIILYSQISSCYLIKIVSILNHVLQNYHNSSKIMNASSKVTKKIKNNNNSKIK